jgi:hypothetical protein
MFNMDIETLVRLLVFVFVIGAVIVQFLYKAFVKPMADAEARRRMARPDQDPGRAVRDLLAELRGEGPAPAESKEREGGLRDQDSQEGRRRPEPPAAGPRDDLEWEVLVEDGRPPHARPLQPPVPPPLPGNAAAPERRREPSWAGRPGRGRRAQPAATGEEPPRRRKGLTELRPNEAPSTFDGRGMENQLSEHVAKTFGGSLQVTYEPGARPGDAAPVKRPQLLGMGLRAAILAQTILGPPRCRQAQGGPRAGWTPASGFVPRVRLQVRKRDRG